MNRPPSPFTMLLSRHTRRREFITLLGGAAPRGRSRRARSSASGCGASACSCPAAADDPEGQARIAAFLQGLQQLGWTTAATCGSTVAGARAMPTLFADTRRNWSRSRRTSSWRMAPRPWRRCYRRPAPCRSCSRSSPIRSAPASSIAWRGRAATPPVSSLSNTASSGKWLELLKQIAPRVTRAAVLRDPAIAVRHRPVRPPSRRWRRRFGVEVSPVDVRDAGEIERAVAAFARAAEWRPDRDGERAGAALIAN